MRAAVRMLQLLTLAGALALFMMVSGCGGNGSGDETIEVVNETATPSTFVEQPPCDDRGGTAEL